MDILNIKSGSHDIIHDNKNDSLGTLVELLREQNNKLIEEKSSLCKLLFEKELEIESLKDIMNKIKPKMNIKHK